MGVVEYEPYQLQIANIVLDDHGLGSIEIEKLEHGLVQAHIYLHFLVALHEHHLYALFMQVHIKGTRGFCIFDNVRE